MLLLPEVLAFKDLVLMCCPSHIHYLLALPVAFLYLWFFYKALFSSAISSAGIEVLNSFAMPVFLLHLYFSIIQSMAMINSMQLS